MNRYVISIVLGPVQTFIAAARRTRDLAFGSILMSELSKACARHLASQSGAELIFPFPLQKSDLSQGSQFTVVNKVLAEVSALDEAAMQQLARECKDAVQKQLEREFEKAWSEAKRLLAGKVEKLHEDRAKQQLGGIIEFSAGWALSTAQSYAVARQQAEANLAARQSLRDFWPHAGISGVPKSSLDGVRETVIEWGPSEPKDLFVVRYKEQLDSVGVLKRFGGSSSALRFESTLDVAPVPYLVRLNREMPTELNAYYSFLRANKSDIPESAAYLYGFDSRKTKNKGPLAEKLASLIEPTAAIKPQPPYYALFVGDGDSMGRLISSIDGINAHQSLSMNLSQFAAHAQHIVDKDHGGQAVYAGGDDVVALLPLHTALACAAAIRKLFDDAFQGAGATPTFSAGMAVAHALEPLDQVRRLAKRTEDLAKRHHNSAGAKNALAIVVSPRSGVDEEAIGKWDTLLPKLLTIQDLYGNGRLSKGLGHELRLLLKQPALAEIDDGSLIALARAVARKKQFSEESISLVDEAASREDLSFLVACLFVARPFARAKIPGSRHWCGTNPSRCGDRLQRQCRSGIAPHRTDRSPAGLPAVVGVQNGIWLFPHLRMRSPTNQTRPSRALATRLSNWSPFAQGATRPDATCPQDSRPSKVGFCIFT